MGVTGETARSKRWVPKAKAIAIVIGALGTAVAAGTAHFQPEEVAEKTAGAAGKAIAQLQAELAEHHKAIEDAQAACQRVSDEGVAKAKAEADSARELLLGFLIASRGRVAADTRQALGRVVKQLGERKAETLKPLIERAPPKPTPRAKSVQQKIEPQLKKLKALSNGTD